VLNGCESGGESSRIEDRGTRRGKHDLAFSRKVAGIRPALSAPFRHDSILALTIKCNNVHNVRIYTSEELFCVASSSSSLNQAHIHNVEQT
jgi:hypothetical protein